MATIKCPAPDCNMEWPADTPTDVLTRLLDIHSTTAHAAPRPAPAQATAAKAEKVRRPVISAAGTSETWAYFLQRWTDYKQATRLTGPDVVYQLLECCEEDLRKDLTRTFGALASSNEATIISNIKTLAVRQENVMVARVQLQQMRQDRDETVRAFAARLRGQAGVCNFSVKCASDTCQAITNYSDIMVRDVLIRGLNDEEIRLDILGESGQDLSLEDALRFIEAKESGKRSASRLIEGNPSSVSATSTYKRQNKPRPDGNGSSPTTCGYCGKSSHGSGRQERMQKCPAYGKRCTKCGTAHHFANVCRKSSQANTAQPNALEDAAATFDNLCSTDVAPCASISLDHHVYNEFCNAWEKKILRPPTLRQRYYPCCPLRRQVPRFPYNIVHPPHYL